jgi:hypothetical protein
MSEICQIFDTLVGDGEQFHDLTSPHDQLVLGMKGTPKRRRAEVVAAATARGLLPPPQGE